MIVAVYVVPASVFIETRKAPATTWSLVKMSPWLSNTNPDPISAPCAEVATISTTLFIVDAIIAESEGDWEETGDAGTLECVTVLW